MLHRTVPAVLVLACAAGLLFSGMPGHQVVNKVTHAVRQQDPAGNFVIAAWFCLIGGLAAWVFVVRSRRVSWMAAWSLSLANLASVLLVLLAVSRDIGDWHFSWSEFLRIQVEEHVELWPMEVVRAAAWVAVFGGPALLLVHGVAWLAEDDLRQRRAVRERAAAPAV